MPNNALQATATAPSAFAGATARQVSFDGTMKFGYHHCSQAQFPVAVPELWR